MSAVDQPNPGRRVEAPIVHAIFRLPGAVECSASVERWLDAQPGELATIARTWLACMRQGGAGVRELMHDGCPTACIGDAAFAYVGVYKAHVSVGFFNGAALPDPAGLLRGTGKHMRHVKLAPGQAVDHRAIEALITAAFADTMARLEAEQMARSPHPDVDVRMGPLEPLPVLGGQYRLLLRVRTPSSLIGEVEHVHRSGKVTTRIGVGQLCAFAHPGADRAYPPWSIHLFTLASVRYLPQSGVTENVSNPELQAERNKSQLRKLLQLRDGDLAAVHPDLARSLAAALLAAGMCKEPMAVHVHASIEHHRFEMGQVFHDDD